MPEWMTKKALPENDSVLDVGAEVLDHIFDAIEQKERQQCTAA